MKKYFGLLAMLIVLLTSVIIVTQFITLRRAHGSFENYYTFRGCTRLITKSDTYGLCKTQAGTTIKIVKFQGKWYLDGDLPRCFFNVCL